MLELLFVDDDAFLLRGLRNSLRRFRDRYQVRIAESGAAALQLLQAQPAQVVVSDMRMPEMNGAELLTEVKARYPSAVRLLLTGHSERNALVAAASVAHHILTKPCDTDRLTRIIDRACALRALLAEPRFTSLEAQHGRLPSQAPLQLALNDELAKPQVDRHAVVRLIEGSPGTAAQLARAGELLLGAGRAGDTVPVLVDRLGIDVVESLVPWMHLHAWYEAQPGADLDWAAEEHALALSTAVLARRLATPDVSAHDCFSAGLLSRAGYLLLRRAQPDTAPFPSAAEAGAWLLARWGMPDLAVESALQTVTPRAGTGSPDVPAWVHAAAALLKGDELDAAWMQSIGAANRLDDWKAYAADERATLARMTTRRAA